MKCLNCGRELQPALDCIRDYDGQWDEHSFRCECSPDIIITIG